MARSDPLVSNTVNKNVSEHVERVILEDLTRDGEDGIPKDPSEWAELKLQADAGEAYEQSLTIWQSLKTYKHAVAWSVIASLCCMMESFDVVLIGQLFALPAFREKFGTYAGAANGYQISAAWQSGVQQGGNVGAVGGVILGSYSVERFGYRRTILTALFVMIPLVAMIAFAPNLPTLCVAQVLVGLPWGIFSTLSPAYASEVCPVRLRGYLTTFVNMCWVMGHLVGAGILLRTQLMTGIWSYRLPFCLQWAWLPPLIIGVYFAPESPWWLVRKGQYELAEKSLRRLGNSKNIGRTQESLAAMIRTNKLETDVGGGSQSVWRCFQGTDRRRTEISVMAWCIQVLCGNNFANNATYFFEQAGFASANAFKISLGLYGAGFIGTVGSWFLLTFFGRRQIFLGGLLVLCSGLFIIGGLSVVADHGSVGARWGQGALMIVWLFTFDLTVGPLSYCIIGETSSTRLRNQTVALSRAIYNCVSVTAGVLSPYMLNPTEWNWRGKMGFFYGCTCFCCVVWAFWRLPEMKDRSYFELDILFERKISARNFKKTAVERTADDHERQNHGNPILAE